MAETTVVADDLPFLFFFVVWPINGAGDRTEIKVGVSGLMVDDGTGPQVLPAIDDSEGVNADAMLKIFDFFRSYFRYYESEIQSKFT